MNLKIQIIMNYPINNVKDVNNNDNNNNKLVKMISIWDNKNRDRERKKEKKHDIFFIDI